MLNTPRCSDKTLQGGLWWEDATSFSFPVFPLPIRLNVSQMCQLDVCFGVFARWPVNPKSFTKMDFKTKKGPFLHLQVASIWRKKTSMQKFQWTPGFAEERRQHVISYEDGRPRKALFCSQVEGRQFNVLTFLSSTNIFVARSLLLVSKINLEKT